MKLSKFLAGMLVLCATVSAQAEYFLGPFTVDAVMPSSGGLHVKLSPNPSQCTGSWWDTQFLIDKGVANYDVLISSMLAAHMAGKKIKAVHYTAVGSGACNAGNQLSVGAFQIIN